MLRTQGIIKYKNSDTQFHQFDARYQTVFVFIQGRKVGSEMQYLVQVGLKNFSFPFSGIMVCSFIRKRKTPAAALRYCHY